MSIALEHDPPAGFTVTGEGFLPGERVTVLAKAIGGAWQAIVDQDGAFRVAIGAAAPAGGGTLWITATGDHGSRAALVLPRPSRLH